MDHDLADDLATRDHDREGPESVADHDTRPLLIERTRGTATRLGISVPTAIGGVFLVCALAFGANLAATSASLDSFDGAAAHREPDKTDSATEPVVERPGDGVDGSEPVDSPEAPDKEVPIDEPEPTDKPEPVDETEPVDKPEPTEKPESIDKPEPKPTEKPEPKPTPKPIEKPVLGLSLAIKEGAVFIDWSRCEVDGADVYKVVRSSDSTVRWPGGDNDKVVAATEVGGATKAWDEHALAGKKVWYRVFCLRHAEDGYRVVAASAAKSIVTPDKPKPTPVPEPDSMWIEAGVDGGAVVLHWEACGADGFSHYRILRKVDGEAALLAEIESAGITTYVDEAVEAGITYHYLVQAKGHVGDDRILLGTTEWTSVTVE